MNQPKLYNYAVNDVKSRLHDALRLCPQSCEERLGGVLNLLSAAAGIGTYLHQRYAIHALPGLVAKVHEMHADMDTRRVELGRPESTAAWQDIATRITELRDEAGEINRRLVEGVAK